MIGEAGKQASDGVRGQLGEVGGDNSPCTLHHELHEEGSGDQQSLIRSVRPEWNDNDAKNEGRDNRSSAAQSVGEVAENYTAEDCSDT